MFAVYITCPCCTQWTEGGKFSTREKAERFVRVVQSIAESSIADTKLEILEEPIVFTAHFAVPDEDIAIERCFLSRREAAAWIDGAENLARQCGFACIDSKVEREVR